VSSAGQPGESLEGSPNRKHERHYLYKYVSATTAKAILTTRTLRWSSPIRFNDPFDVTQELRLDFGAAELSAALVEEMVDLLATGDPIRPPARPDMSPFFEPMQALLRWLDELGEADRQRFAETFRRNAPQPTVGQAEAIAELKERWSAIVPNLRVICFSEANDVTPMWHHYADGYRGVVLQFEAVDELDSVWLLARPVVYQAEPPAIADARTWARCMLRKDERTYQDLFTEYQYTKTPDWAYEREWRVATFALPEESGDFSSWPFNPRELAAVYLGPRSSEQDQADIVALLTSEFAHVRVFRARIVGAAGRFHFDEVRKSS
jgi:hypothetical protein